MPISARTDDLPDSGRSRASGVEMPDISDIEDIVDAMELCEEHEVPYGGLEDIDEFVERLRLHFIKQRCQESRKKQSLEESTKHAWSLG